METVEMLQDFNERSCGDEIKVTCMTKSEVSRKVSDQFINIAFN